MAKKRGINRASFAPKPATVAETEASAAAAAAGTEPAVSSVQEPASAGQSSGAGAPEPDANQAQNSGSGQEGTGSGVANAMAGVVTDGEAQKGPESAENTAAQGIGVSGSEQEGSGTASKLPADAGAISRLDAEGEAGPAEDQPLNAAFFARDCAISCSGLARYHAGGGNPVDLADVGFDTEEAAIMADFVRQWPDAPLLAMYEQLRLKKRYPATHINNEDMLALTIFHAACLAAFAFERAEAADQAERATPATAAGRAWPGDLAMQPQPSAFDAAGFSPRR